MSLLPIKDIVKSRLLVPALVFFGVNFTYSYMFYQVNSFKIFLTVIGVMIIAIWNDLLFPRNVEQPINWKHLLLISLPLLSTLPGVIYYQAANNYNFKYELTSNLVLIVWIAYLIRGAKEEKDVSAFLTIIGITVIYAGLWAILEKNGYDPKNFGGAPVDRVKSTFGNINYFAGFLVVLLPLLLALAIPERLPDYKSLKGFVDSYSSFSLFFLIAFIFGLISLSFTETRAAIAATAISLPVIVVGYAFGFTSRKWRIRLLLGLAALVALGVLSFTGLYLFSEQFQSSRFASLLSVRAWTPRYVSWQAAWYSILASPVIGWGLGSSYNLYFLFADPDARLIHSEHSYNHVHSEILEFLQEGGIVGLVAFLIFWGFTAFFLIKVVLAADNSKFMKRLAIGCLGGMVGFHLHGTFSVAPRMMVMKLPLFTLIALAFIVFNLTRQQSDTETDKTFSKRVTRFLPSLACLLLIFYIYIPWIIGQYHFVKIQRERPSLLKVEKLERMVKQYPDAYALDFLSHLQVQYRRAPQLQETVDLIDVILPNYRELGHTKAVLAILQKDLQRAKRLGKTFQDEQDRYYKPTIFLLLGLAIDTNDYPLFKEQFKLLVRKNVFDTGLFRSLSAADAPIEIKELDAPFKVNKGDGRFEFIWSEKLVSNFFKIARTTRKKQSYSKKDKNSLLSYLAFNFSRNEYFRIEIKDEYKHESNLINETLKQYFTAKRDSAVKSNKLAQKHNLALARAPKNKRAALQKQQKIEKSEAAQANQSKINELTSNLNQRTNFNTYISRQGFVNSFIQEFANIIFPRVGNK